MDIDILGIDLAKQVFQLHGADRRGHALHGSKVLRAELLGAVRKLQPYTSTNLDWSITCVSYKDDVKRLVK